MKFLKPLFLMIAGMSFLVSNAQSDFEIRKAQNSCVRVYAALSDYIGNDNVTIQTNEIKYDSQHGYIMFLKFHYTANKVVADNGRTYYNVQRKGSVVFTDVERVYTNGERIILQLNSNGYANMVKVPGENWTEVIKNKSDFSITVKDNEKREKILEILQVLTKYPRYRVKK